MALTYPQIDPVAFSLGPLQVRWYGLAYVCGIFLGWAYIRWLSRRQRLSVPVTDLDDYIPWVAVGIVAGGRLGHVLFYGFSYYLQNPLEIVQIWKPGMSFHGGFLGVVAATYFFSRARQLSVLALLDAVAVAGPVGLFFGRLANFINGELFGRITTVSWGMVFPNGGPYVRHPSQLYEAALEGVLLWGILNAALFGLRRRQPGLIAGIFILFYGIFRFSVEFVREPDRYQGFLSDLLSYGQLLSVPMIIVGLAWVCWQWPRHVSTA